MHESIKGVLPRSVTDVFLDQSVLQLSRKEEFNGSNS